MSIRCLLPSPPGLQGGPLRFIEEAPGGPLVAGASVSQPLRKMLHEVLMALSGYPGDLFVRWESEQGGLPEAVGGLPPPCEGVPQPAASSLYTGGGFVINPQLKAFTDSERQALEAAVQPGYDLLLVREFIAAAETQRGAPTGGSLLGQGGPHGSLSNSQGPPQASPLQGTQSQKAADSSAAAASPAAGLYISALAQAARELTAPYLSCLLAAEETVLQQPATPLSALTLALGDQPHRIKTLRHVLSQVKPKP